MNGPKGGNVGAVGRHQRPALLPDTPVTAGCWDHRHVGAAVHQERPARGQIPQEQGGVGEGWGGGDGGERAGRV